MAIQQSKPLVFVHLFLHAGMRCSPPIEFCFDDKTGKHNSRRLGANGAITQATVGCSNPKTWFL
jgi:hypothetical protein